MTTEHIATLVICIVFRFIIIITRANYVGRRC